MRRPSPSPLSLAALAALAAALGVLPLALPRPARAQGADDARALGPEESELLRLVNDYRRRQRLAPLAPVPVLNAVAHRHSAEMARRGFFSHVGPDGRSPFDRMRAEGYRGGAMAENIAAGSPGGRATFEQWRTSPPHRRNMLGRAYRAVGLGRAHAPGSALTYYWTATFGDVVP